MFLFATLFEIIQSQFLLFNFSSAFFSRLLVSAAKPITRLGLIELWFDTGFAAETSEIYNNAEEKLNSKNCDWIISNDVSRKDIGFNSNYNEVTIHYKSKDIKREKLSYKNKSIISDEIVDRIIDQLN